MANKKEIGKAFKDKLENLQRVPSDMVWDNIVDSLDKKKKVIPIWIKLVGVATILLAIGLFFQNNSNLNTNNSVVIVKDKKNINLNRQIKNTIDVVKNENSHKNDLETKFTVTNEDKKNVTNKITSKNSIQEKRNIIKTNITLNNFKKGKTNKEAIPINNSFLSNNSIKNPNKFTKDNLEKIINSTKRDGSGDNLPLDVKMLLRDRAKNIYDHFSFHKKDYLIFTFAKLPSLRVKDIIKESPTKSEDNHWDISVKATPIYYGSFNKGSTIGDNFYSTIICKPSFTTAVGVSIPITNSISLRTGISKIDFTYITNNVNTEKIINSQIVINSQILQDGNYFFTNNESLLLTPGSKFQLFQKINYIEIPLEFSYKLINKKIEVDIITGVSTLILNDNSILINNKTNIGSVNNLNKLSFTGNLGFGFAYKITKNINVSVEPIIKLQFNTYSNNVNFKPYYFGVYSGFSYKF